MGDAPVPVLLFAYARPDHLAKVLECLRRERVPLIHAFADGPRAASEEAATDAVRAQLRAVNWCEMRVVERPVNLGLGRSILSGVSEVAAAHELFIVWEDDLICVPGTYAWMTAALRHYRGAREVFSVTAWSHPRITPRDVAGRPYLDGRAECWVWGAYARSWRGMAEETAMQKLKAAQRRGISPGCYGHDLPLMARREKTRNIWAVRWLYHHLQHGGLCVRPPWSMVEHIGFDASATNAQFATAWRNPPLHGAAPVPETWPPAEEHPMCRSLWQAANPPSDVPLARRVARRLVPTFVRQWFNRRRAWRWFRGDYGSWEEARAASGGYDANDILARARGAAQAVRRGEGRWERDGAVFDSEAVNEPLLAALREAAREGGFDVVDIGGAFGGVWWQHREQLASLGLRRWAVVEQPRFVEAGRAEFADKMLSFHADVPGALNGAAPHVALLSCVLPYVDDPEKMLRSVAAAGFRHVILDRTPLARDGRQRLAVQHVPPSLGGGSYPAWIFSRDRILAPLLAEYRLVAEWPGFDDVDPAIEYRGFHFRRKAGDDRR